MDEHRYQEWLTLWESSDTLYWVPCNDDDIDPRRQVSIIYDDHDRLVQRVERLLSGTVLALQPGRQELWAGQALHRLRMRDGTHRILSKKVLLNNSDQEIPLVQFLI